MVTIEGTQPDSPKVQQHPEQYLRAIVTMTTVGYGDITPVTGFESSFPPA